MPVVINDVFRVALNWEGPSPMIAENVIHILAGTGTSADVAEAVFDAINSNMWQMVSDSFSIVSVDVTPLDGNNLTTTTGGLGTGDFRGQASGDFIPNACALVKHTTDTGGRSGRGRTYLPALGESRQSNGVSAAAQRALTTTGWNDFQTSLLAWPVPCALVIASYTRLIASVVTHSACETAIATQRRRLVR